MRGDVQKNDRTNIEMRGDVCIKEKKKNIKMRGDV